MSNMFFFSQSDAQKSVAELFSSFEKFCFSMNDIKDSSCYMVTDDLSAIDCLSLIRGRQITSILQNSIQCLADKITLLKTIDYKCEDYFNINLSFVDGDVVSYVFGPDDDRNEVIERAFLPANLEIDMTKYQYLYQVAAELVMNAQIDAPKISGKSNVAKSRLLIEKNKTKGLVAISVVDYYGSLDCYKLLENVYAAHKDGFRNSMSKNSIGAGLGSAMIYEFADSMIMGVIPDVMSRVTAILPYGVSEKKINQIQKSIHIVRG